MNAGNFPLFNFVQFNSIKQTLSQNNRHYHKAALHKSGCLMRKLEVTVARVNSLRQHEEQRNFERNQTPNGTHLLLDDIVLLLAPEANFTHQN